MYPIQISLPTVITFEPLVKDFHQLYLESKKKPLFKNTMPVSSVRTWSHAF